MFKFFNKNKVVPENWHVDFITNLASLIKPNVYVELGLYECELFNKLIPHAKKLIGIDINDRARSFMKKSEKTHFINQTTTAYAKSLVKRTPFIDMLFIDANHDKKNVINDFNLFLPYVKEQGIILIHDTYPKNKKYTNHKYCSDAYLAVIDLAKKNVGYELMTLPVHPGLTLCRKRTKQLKWL